MGKPNHWQGGARDGYRKQRSWAVAIVAPIYWELSYSVFGRYFVMRVPRSGRGTEKERHFSGKGQMMGDDNTQEFLNLFRRLETLIRTKHDLGKDASPVAWLIKTSSLVTAISRPS